MPEIWCQIEGYDGERWRPLFLRPEQHRHEMESDLGLLLDMPERELEAFGGYISECEDFRMVDITYTTPEERARIRRKRERREAERLAEAIEKNRPRRKQRA